MSMKTVLILDNREDTDEMQCLISKNTICIRFYSSVFFIPDRIAQSITCLATDAGLTADPGFASLIPARSHTFVEIDHVIISTAILLHSAESSKKG